MRSKDTLAQWMGLEPYDTALPQDWLDKRVDRLMLMAGYFPPDGDDPAHHISAFLMTPEQYREMRTSVYDAILFGTVWAYDTSGAGFPVAVSPVAYMLQCFYNQMGGDSAELLRIASTED